MAEPGRAEDLILCSGEGGKKFGGSAARPDLLSEIEAQRTRAFQCASENADKCNAEDTNNR